MKNLIKLSVIAGICVFAACKGKNASDNTDSTQSNASAGKNVIEQPKDSKDIAVENNYEIQIPATWHTEEKATNGRTLFFLIGPKEMNYQTNINVLKDPMKGENLDDYIKISLAKMQSMPVTMGPTGTFSANGTEGKYLKYIYNAPERTIAVKSYVFPKNDTAYVVTATTIPELGKKYEPVFDKAVSSLKIR